MLKPDRRSRNRVKELTSEGTREGGGAMININNAPKHACKG